MVWGESVYNVAVLEPKSGHVRDRLVKHTGGDALVFTRGEEISAFSGTYDLFLVAGGKTEGKTPPLQTKILLLPDKAPPEIVAGISSGWVVSYGLSGKDSITLSSLEPGFAVLTLQRELVTLAETVVEQQEIPLSVPRDLDAQEIMAIYGSLLVLGEKPETLRAGFSSPLSGRMGP